MTIIIFLFLLSLLVAALPVYTYSREWGYYPSSIIATIASIVALLLMLK
jgi:hypothetical protein